MENTNDTRKTRLIFDAKIARTLLKRGFVVIDIKPNRENKDKSIFIFNNTDEFKTAFDEVLAKFKSKENLNDEPIEIAD